MATLWFVSNSGSDSNTGTSQAQAYATIGKALSSAVSGDTIGVQTGTYTVTATLVITQATLTIEGYQTTPGDLGTPPLVTTATNSTDLWQTSSNGGYQLFNNIHFSNTASTKANGIIQLTTHGTTQWWIFLGCTFDGFSGAVNSDDSGAHFDVGFIYMVACEVKNCTGTGSFSYIVIGATNTLSIDGCYFHNNSGGRQVWANAGGLQLTNTIFAASTNTLAYVYCSGSSPVLISNCTFTGNTACEGFNSLTFAIKVRNCIFYGLSRAIDMSTPSYLVTASNLASRNNAFGNNTNTNNTWPAGPGDVTLSASPFTNPSGGNYSLNATSGAGAACKAAGFQGVFPGGTSTGFVDIGAVQSGSSAPSNSGFIY